MIWFSGGGDPRVFVTRVQDRGKQWYSLLQEMSTDLELRNIPVLMISEVEDIKSVVRCIELGATDYLTKPFNPVLLKARIDKCIEQAHYRCYGAGDEGVAPSLLSNEPMERPMKRNDLSRSLVAFDQNITLVSVVELSGWQVV